ncbi:uncharacterized protein RSE6_14857 [Rhynchosporium secalis]|uniref:CFEM domain-containing protein n=1 Tax=Rhynchosporium secalis TaxID=38038 RepID=A0A1E1MWB8_RHYSE|nr:uncharacterized protein RSE6_14857 [Rhynchosporium secalis]
MKSAILLSAVLGLATAQNFAGQPPCAVPCLKTAIEKAGCALSDEGCQCGSGKAAIAAAVGGCLVAACKIDELLVAQKAGNDACLAYSATGPTPNNGTAASNTTATSTTATSYAATTGTHGGSHGGSVNLTDSTNTTGHASPASPSPATTSPPSRTPSTSASGRTPTAGAATSTAGAVQGVAGVGMGGFAGLLLGLLAAL